VVSTLAGRSRRVPPAARKHAHVRLRSTSPPDQFVGRKDELHHIASRIAEHGASSGVIGQPRTGKSSISSYFASPLGLGLIQSRTAARLLVLAEEHFAFTAEGGSRVLEERAAELTGRVWYAYWD
jgi:hypothetical protein